MLNVIYDDQNIRTRGHMDRQYCDGNLGTYCGVNIRFSGKFRRAPQLHQSFSEDQSEITTSQDGRDI